MTAHKRDAGEAAYVAKNYVLLDVKWEIVQADRLGTHPESKEIGQKDDAVFKMLGCVDGAVCVTRRSSSETMPRVVYYLIGNKSRLGLDIYSQPEYIPGTMLRKRKAADVEESLGKICRMQLGLASQVWEECSGEAEGTGFPQPHISRMSTTTIGPRKTNIRCSRYDRGPTVVCEETALCGSQSELRNEATLGLANMS